MRTNLTVLAHKTAEEFFSDERPKYAIDATLGNGHDAVFLANLVAEGGRVFGFDVQKSAVEKSRAALAKNFSTGRYELFLSGHENMARLLPPELTGKIGCAFFNLGWLPDSDKSTITAPETTLAALAAVLEFINRRRGLLSVLSYTGHDGGAAECTEVEKFFVTNFGCAYGRFCDESNNKSPVLFVKKFCETANI